MKVEKVVLVIVLVTALVVSCLVGCTAQPGPAPESQAPASQAPESQAPESQEPAPVAPEDREDLSIGVISSGSGQGSSIGDGQKKAAALAVEEVNAAGGVTINGVTYNFKLESADDETKPEIAISRAKEMVREKGVTCILGGTLGNISTALNVEAMDNSFLFMASNGVPEVFYDEGAHSDTAMCVTTVAWWIGRGAGAYMMGQAGAKKVACMMPDYSIGQDTYKGFEHMAQNYPDVEYKVIYHPVGAADLSSYIIQARDYKPDFLFIGSWANDAITALKQCNEMGIKDQMKIFHFWLMDEFATGIPAEAIDGVYGQVFWYHDMTGFPDTHVVEESARLTKSYFDKYGEIIGPYAMSSYYAVLEFKRGMELAQSTEPLKVAEALKANPEFTTAKGDAVWRQNGVPVYENSSWIVEGLGMDERVNTPYGAELDWCKILVQVEGKDFVPALD